MNYWLVKTEPGTYSWNQLVKDKKATWDGVRNFQARNNMKEMHKGDRVLVYHSGDDKCIMGIAKVSKEHYPDQGEPVWVVVDLIFEKSLHKPVSLSQIKARKSLSNMVLVRNSRLSVQPVKSAEFEEVLQLSE